MASSARNWWPASVITRSGGVASSPRHTETSSAWVVPVAATGKIGSARPASMINRRGAIMAARSAISNQVSRSGTALQMQWGTVPKLPAKELRKVATTAAGI